jgi:hypothetical protein
VGHHTDSQKATLIWIDYFCIDQSNTLERNHQVAMMSHIYSHADSVVLWLGKADAGSDDVIDAIRRTGSSEIHSANLNGYVDQLLALLNRKYWSRMWIIQECLLAKRLVIFAGRKSFEHSPKFSSHSMFWISSCLDCTKIARMSVPGFRLLSQSDNPEMRSVSVSLMPEFLETWSQNLCNDPRDKVFALLGLTDHAEAWPKADYTMEPVDVYSAVLQTYVQYCYESSSLSPERFRQVMSRCLFSDNDSANQTVRQIEEGFFENMEHHGIYRTVSPLDHLLQRLDSFRKRSRPPATNFDAYTKHSELPQYDDPVMADSGFPELHSIGDFKLSMSKLEQAGSSPRE